MPAQRRTIFLLLIVFVCCLGASVALAQSGTINGQIISPFGQPVPNGLVRVCAYTSTGSPCTPLSNLFADPGMTVPLPNPYSADQFGNYSVFIASNATYIVQISAGAGVTYSYLTTVGGGGGSGTPGAPVSSVQFNSSGSLGGDASFNFSATSHLLQVMNLAQQLPKVDPRSAAIAAFGGCANPADPSDTLDSTCAIQAAINYAASHPLVSQADPCVYLAAGAYKVTSTITWPTTQIGSNLAVTICMLGDSRQASIIDATGLGANNLFTFNRTGSPQGQIKLFGGGLIADIQVTGADLQNTGSMIEFNNTDDVDIMRVACTNWAGRCFNLYGDSERNVFYHITCNSSNICVDTGFQANENRFLDPAVLFPGQTDGTNLCYHTGINCPASTHAYPPANTGVCANYPAWSAGVPTAKGTVICDANGDIEVATSYGMTGPSVPVWTTTAYGFTCDGNGSDCTASPVPYGKTDWSSPVQWENAVHSTLIIPDPTPAVFLSGNKNIWDGGSDKSLGATSAIDSVGVTNVIQNIYCEGSPFSGQPRTSFCIWVGDVDTGVSSTFTTAVLSPTALTVPVVSSVYMYGGHLGTDADAAAGNSSFGVEIACPDYDPTSSSACTTAGFNAFNKNQIEKVNMNAFSNNNNGQIHTGGRCTTGSSAGLCTAGVGVAWPAGAIVMLSQASSNAANAANIHSTATNSRGNSGYFALSSETLNTKLADGRMTSLASGEFGVGPRPDGRAFTNIDGTTQGFGGTSSGTLMLEYFTPTTGYDAYLNQAGVVIPLNGNILVRDNDPGLSAANLPTGITIGSVDQYVRPGIQIAVHGTHFTRGDAIRQTLGQIWTFGPNGSQGYVRQIRANTFAPPADPADILGGFQFANQYCMADIPTLNSTSTQPFMRECDEGGPANTANARWHFDLFQNNAWNAIETIDAQGLHQSGVGIPGIGLSSNYVRNSGDLNGTGWVASAGTPSLTITCGQADPYGGNNACLVNVGASTVNFEYSNTASAAYTSLQTLTACVWMKGVAGGENVLFDAVINNNVAPLFEAGGTTGLTTSWSRYSGTGTGFGNTRPFRWGEGGVQPAQSFFIYNPQTQMGSTCGPDLITTASVFSTLSVLSANNGIFNSLGDMNGSTGTIGQVATALGTGGWHWATIPAAVAVRAGTVTIASGTTQPVTFSTPMGAAPTSCSLTPQGTAATAGTPFATSLATTGFTANISGTAPLTMTYQCIINNSN